MNNELAKARAKRYRANKKDRTARLEQELTAAKAEIQRLRKELASVPEYGNYRLPERKTVAELVDQMRNSPIPD